MMNWKRSRAMGQQRDTEAVKIDKEELSEEGEFKFSDELRCTMDKIIQGIRESMARGREAKVWLMKYLENDRCHHESSSQKG
ncbi:unnamed protein product [Larinioides sclopetarius]|uniref:Uncharacterized protein n=1 Tax=Larinioides sclopetarius TaxID=280406 RepID=A0AAV2A3Z4_9ARAC